MSVVKEIQKCPYCKEAIAPGAIKCKHCFSEISSPQKASPFKKYNNFRLGFLVGILFLLVVELLIYIQFFSAN